jgi:hypothetical protein
LRSIASVASAIWRVIVLNDCVSTPNSSRLFTGFSFE